MRAVSHSLAGVLLAAATMIAVVVLAQCSAGTLPPVDRDKLTITLRRSACYGTCPDYSVTVHGDGRVVFLTEGATDAVSGLHRSNAPSSGVLVPGRHEDRIDPAAVDALVQEFREANFFSLRDEYRAGITDNPTYVLVIDTGHGAKTVVDYVGQAAGMPSSVTRLEGEVDRVARTARWVRGAVGLVEALEVGGFDFHSNQAVALMIAGVDQADESTLTALIERGAPLEIPLRLNPASHTSELAGRVLLREAILFGRPSLFRALVERGWLERSGRVNASIAFAQGAAGCNPAMVDVAFSSGVPVDPPPAQRRPLNATDDYADYDRQNSALANLATSYRCHDEASRIAVAEHLLAHGADPNRRNVDGQTAIYGVENLNLVNLLLAHGADARVPGYDGNSVVFGSWTDAIVLRLLQAGASPEGHYYDGLTLAQQTRERNMPMTAAWLSTHASRRN
jgi:hypothetical protein